MRAVEDRANSNSERASAVAALPPLITTVATDMPPYVFALAIRANWVPVPPRLFKMVNRLFVGLEGLEKFEDVHGHTISFDAQPYHDRLGWQVHKRTIPIYFERFLFPT